MHRQPAVAGSFYPANAGQLQAMLEQLLKEAPSSEKVPKTMIVPHAGYVYSGPIAATAYARLQPASSSISRVVLLGPSHRVAFQGLALSGADYFRTPLGDIAVDKEAAELLRQLPFVGYLEQAHTFEHSLEVHLPFLQQTLQNFKIVPLVAGDASPEQVAEVLETLWGGPETLIVISSDLSHYHDYATATAMDRLTSIRIEQLQYQSIPADAACGKVPVAGLLKLAEQRGMQVKTIDLRNSGDTAGDKSRVVGYGAYVID